MRPAHLERLRPICPVCRVAGRTLEPLKLGTVARSEGDDVIEGVLVCANGSCRREHPIIDGIAIIVPDIATYIRDHYNAIMARTDLSPLLHGVIGDCTGPDSAFDQSRYYVSSYASSHYPSGDQPSEHGLASLIDVGVKMLSSAPAGMWIDIGCSTGRASFDLAARTEDLVLGVDLNFAMLRLAREIAVRGRATYARRRVGVVYDPCEIELNLPHRDKVELWACDAAALPFENESFGGACSMNVVDSVASPLDHLAEMGRVIRAGAEAIICTPYDWSAAATAMPSWIGGHSQRSDTGGNSPDEMRRVLSDESPPNLGIRLRLVRDQERVPWQVRMHERAEVVYQAHMIVARRGT